MGWAEDTVLGLLGSPDGNCQNQPLCIKYLLDTTHIVSTTYILLYIHTYSLQLLSGDIIISI